MAVRKRIAVITAEIFNEYMNRTLIGISEQSEALGYDVCVFTMTINCEGETAVQYGEENIFSLISAENTAGIIVDFSSMDSFELRKRIEEKITTLGIPAVSLEYETPVCGSVYLDNSELFGKMTDHLIEMHNCREIMCLTGPRGSVKSETKVQGYRNSLKKHGIPYTEKLVVYGESERVSAKCLADDFISGKKKIPDAVICANDTMAANLCNCLIRSGIKVPEQVRITGCDHFRKGSYNTTTMATIFPENARLGASAVLELHKNITGEDADFYQNLKKGIIVPAQSCGCSYNIGRFIRKREYISKNVEPYEELFSESGMVERLLTADNLDALFNEIAGFTPLINGLDTVMICLCTEWDDVENENQDCYRSSGYSEYMTMGVICSDSSISFSGEKFRTAELFPESMESDNNHTLFFLPLHFNDRCFGYAVFRFSKLKSAVSSIFARWCRNINVALEFLRVRTKLTSMNQRIALSSIRDTLTGVYNRKGFKRFSETMFKKAKSEQKKLLIMVADLDMLKYINDNHGHIEGDNAITVVANILSSCCINNEVCSRIGGDEYAVVGCFDYTDEMVESYLKNINDYFIRYNSASDKPYNVGASIGYFCGVPDEDSEFQQYFSIADRNMYANKSERKMLRRD